MLLMGDKNIILNLQW